MAAVGRRDKSDDHLFIWQGTEMTWIGGIGLVLHMGLSPEHKSLVELTAVCNFRWALFGEGGMGTTRNWKNPQANPFLH